MRKLRSFSLGSKFTPRRLNVAAVRGAIGRHIHQTLNQPLHVIGLRKLFFPKLFKSKRWFILFVRDGMLLFWGVGLHQRGFLWVGNAALEKHALSKFLFICLFKKKWPLAFCVAGARKKKKKK